MIENCYFNYYLSFNFLINQPEMQKFLGELIILASGIYYSKSFNFYPFHT